MTFAASAALSPATPSLRERVSALHDALAQRADQRRAYRTAPAALEALSDRDRSDLRLARADSAHVTAQA